MKHAQTVTFGGSGLNRAAELRDDIETLLLDPTARAIVLWRGKPMVSGQEARQLVRLDLSHPIVEHATEAPIFLGLEDGAPRLAYDVSGWEPADQDLGSLGEFLDPSAQHHPSVPEDHVFCELRAIMMQLSPREAELAATAKAVQNWHASHGFCAKCGAKSDIAMSGWQRNCPSCGAHHFPRTDPVVIMLILHGNSVLMGRSPGWPEGMYSLLAGFVEPGETLEAAVRREVVEEAGIKVGEVGYLASQPWPFPASLMFGCWGEAISRDITIDPAEIEDAIWVTREEMTDVFAGTHPVIKPARPGAIAHFLLLNWLADTLE
ncbi:NAD(+) diphosphatase [Thalassobium sp. R2A62]|jgi:NAD+ diphosphatase|uniref:NAD(+) diphosphatase n=1 Tax=Thalassobium sp. R2A62 TaxID=633131 RepID=UPI0001B1D1E6|nr:NAD(+) diphosphatase [Thalassobium sp. R2A62]EET48112.1 peroxisomal NADH pyrophosphatase nudt12 [Thalassobium sp. R2A62]MDG1340536.1 NAD(+) diphosphatase [Paracoccaceae bacterium]MDG2451556.1 NAD(+) diphosphatase [Paracoccaceae bacterium]